ncbi:Hypothetical protein Cul210932_1401 [Corynebacterium ulcerans]|uniref:Uncharacterized protein n=1 Tax=Corynebacterium ulcerans FRC58 TaxID=1408268 RepID=A0ABN4GUB8_CORUL|nr:Hypothetical protein Cul210932_1401 [Corynebacterium ulcerans]AIU91928.1 Hypothetical protein Cul05146_1366 [Corynebacterium ulcerans]AKN77220.1 Hypothetical protein CulFRC58_1366 [Corynebacterium ulcerans FRC58]ALD95117.1 Hypothetical protein Cul131001_1420 [Corynebacterium ulcerans]
MFSSNKTNDVTFISVASRKSKDFTVNHGRSCSYAYQKMPATMSI